MAGRKKNRLYTMDEVKDNLIGKRGTSKREKYEHDLQMGLLGDMIKKARLERGLTQEQLGKLVGVGKAQISKLENHTYNVTLETILKIFAALKARIVFRIEMRNQRINIAS